MNITVEDINPTRKTVRISIPGSAISEEEATLIREFASQARIPGFRPGKAPAQLVKKRFAKEVREELKRKMTELAFDKVQEDSGLNIYTVIALEGDDYVPGQDAELAVTIDILPTFELPEYKGIRIEVEPVTVSDEEIDQAIERLREQRADYDVVEGAAQKGDFVRCGYAGRIGEETVEALAPDHPLYGSQKSTWEEAGSEESPGVRAVVDGLVGMSAGDNKTVDMEFPEDFPVEPLRGKKAVYEIAVEEVRQRVLPEVNDTFIQGLGVENLEDLRKQIRDDIENRKKEMVRQRKIDQVHEALLERTDFPLPASAVEQSTQDLLHDFVQRSIRQGMKREELEERRDELFEGASKAAAQRVKLRFIMERIAEAEEIEISNEELSSAVMQEAMMTRTQPDKLVKELQKDRARLQAIRNNALLGKTMDRLIELGETVETPATENAETPQS